MVKKILVLISFFSCSAVCGNGCDLFRDLELVQEIDCELSDRLPFFYNYSFVGGYFTMPSARMPASGDLAFGAVSVPPYSIFGVNFAPFSRIELSGNYRVFRGVEESNFGSEGFGNDADRIGNVKFGILMPEDGLSLLPLLAFGLDDFIGTKRFSSQYVAMTKTFECFNFELSLGWGWGRIKGPFGGASWTPFRQTCLPVIKDLSVVVEYDANDYKKHQEEHFKGRSVSSRVNGGLVYTLGDILQLNVSSVRGKKLGGGATVRFPLGSTEGLFAKVGDPLPYCCPIDLEPLGIQRPEVEFAADLACSFAEQGLDLYNAYLLYEECEGKTLYLQVVNNRYRREAEVRCRLEELLSALTPCDVDSVQVVLEADGVTSHSYLFRTCDLYRFRDCCIGSWEMETLSPMRDACCLPCEYEAALLFERSREIWTFTFRPRLVNFFGATSGKYKYSIGALAAVDGFFPGGLLYSVQAAYSIYSSMHGLQSRDRLNPSRLLHVRSDMVRYFQGGKVRLEQAFLQRSLNLGRGWFFRASGGYFEPAYGGGALEALLFPVRSPWALGVEGAVLWKRRYQGLGFFSRVSKFNSEGEEVFKKYTGLQAFLTLYYDFKPLDLLFEIKAGQFLARDRGARFMVTRTFPSGARFSLWLTTTNGNDRVNGRRYFDKGFVFTIPFDIFLRKSSRTFLGYGMSAWLRDVGAIGATGIPLYSTLYEERVD